MYAPGMRRIAATATLLAALAVMVGGCGTSEVVVRYCSEYGRGGGWCPSWNDISYEDPSEQILALPSCGDNVSKPCRMS